MECAGLERGDAFAHERAAAVDQPCFYRAVLERLLRDLVVVGLVGLAEVGGIGVGQRALLLHPVQRSAGVQPAGEGDADFLADGQSFKNDGHGDCDPWCVPTSAVVWRSEGLEFRIMLDH